MPLLKEREMPVGYDKLSLDYNLLLDLPFREGIGTITRDIAKPHHPLTLNVPGGGSFAWGNLVSGCPYLEFIAVGVGANDGVYVDCPAADTGDLDFTSEDYSVGGWFKWDSTGGESEYIIGRGVVETDGWDFYLNISGHLPVGNTISQRHAHVSGGAGNLKSECFSEGWTPGIWWFFGMSRTGIYTPHYRNGLPVEMDYGGATMLDPDSANRDLVIGARNSKNDHWYRGMMWRLRAWGRSLEPWEWLELFHRERHLFGV